MSDKNEIKPDFQAIAFTEEDWKNAGGGESTAVTLAAHVMMLTRPSFVLIASPAMRMTSKGFIFPREVGISVNDELGITRSVVAAILREVADGLDEDINKVMKFVHEATGQEYDDEH